MQPLSPHTRTRLIWRNGKRVRTHRWLMEQELGRPLLPTEHVHHKDENPLNNDISNLEVLTPAEHMAIHKTKPCDPRPCANCGEVFTPTGRQRHRRKCCSPTCAQAMRVQSALVARGLR